jgi:hypothetical protein
MITSMDARLIERLHEPGCSAVLANVRLIDGRGGPPVERAYVRFHDGKIQQAIALGEPAATSLWTARD